MDASQGAVHNYVNHQWVHWHPYSPAQVIADDDSVGSRLEFDNGSIAHWMNLIHRVTAGKSSGEPLPHLAIPNGLQPLFFDTVTILKDVTP